MPNYFVYPVRSQNDWCWCVFERATDQMIKAFDFIEDAEGYCAFLNEGGAFAGITPSFMLRSVAIKTINETFQEVFA